MRKVEASPSGVDEPNGVSRRRFLGRSSNGRGGRAAGARAGVGREAHPSSGGPLRRDGPPDRRGKADVTPDHGRGGSRRHSVIRDARTEVGQGITTAIAMRIAEEMYARNPQESWHFSGAKSSRPSSRSQKPCLEMFVTSASEVAAPGISDLLLAFFDQSLGSAEVLSVELLVPRQPNTRLDPQLGLAVRRLHMDVHALLLAREEEEPERSLAEYGRLIRGS
jgi:hypothetical protein